MQKDNKGTFNALNLVDRLSELSSANKIDTPSRAFEFQKKLIAFFNEIHEGSYAQGFNDALNIKDNDFSK